MHFVEPQILRAIEQNNHFCHKLAAVIASQPFLVQNGRADVYLQDCGSCTLPEVSLRTFMPH